MPFSRFGSSLVALFISYPIVYHNFINIIYLIYLEFLLSLCSSLGVRHPKSFHLHLPCNNKTYLIVYMMFMSLLFLINKANPSRSETWPQSPSAQPWKYLQLVYVA